MDRLQVSFAVLLVVSLSLGGVTAADIGERFGELDSIGTVRSQVSTTVVDVSLEDDDLVVTARIDNPSSATLQHNGARIRLHNETNERLASGAGMRLDDNGSIVPPEGSLTMRYAVGLSDPQVPLVRSALADGATVSVSFGMTLGESDFVIRTAQNTTGDG